jgi:hypothetical protein
MVNNGLKSTKRMVGCSSLNRVLTESYIDGCFWEY